VFAKILKQIRKKVRTLDYVVTLHADEAMDDDGLTIFDVEEVIFTGDISSGKKTTRQMNGSI